MSYSGEEEKKLKEAQDAINDYMRACIREGARKRARREKEAKEKKKK